MNLIALIIGLLIAQAQDSQPAYTSGGGVSQPKLLSKVEPAYSEEARKAGLQGTVELLIVVNADGTTRDFKVTKGLGLGLNETAIAAVKQWRFQPGLKDGRAVPVFATVQLNFRLLAYQGNWQMTRAAFDPPIGATTPRFIRSNLPNDAAAEAASVTLTLTIDEHGQPRNLKVNQPEDSKLAQDIVAAAGQWRFEPSRHDGIPIATRASFDFSVGPSVIATGAGVSPPKAISQPGAVYSEEARKAQLEGTVVLQFIVTAEGTAVDFKVTASLGLGLDEAAIAAVQQWRFQPGLRAGNPVPVASTAQLNFKLVSNKTGWEMLRAAFDMPQGVERPHVTRSEFPHGKPAGHGTVALTFMIDERGEPKDLSVDKSDSKLEQEIIAAVKKWRFKPATKNGTPIAVQATFEFNALRVF